MIYWKLLVAYVKGSVQIEFEDESLEFMMQKNYIVSEPGETYYINGFPFQEETTKRFITFEGKKAFWKITFKTVVPTTLGLIALLVGLLKLLS